MRGDLLLLKSGGSPRDRLVAWATGGPYVHVEVDLGDGTTLGSHLNDGVAYRPLEREDLATRYARVPISQRVSPEKIEAGLAWMTAQLGHPFSWASMADFILPEWVGALVWGRSSIFNCANLVAHYLAITGGLDLPYGKRPPMTLSPNDIARAAGLL